MERMGMRGSDLRSMDIDELKERQGESGPR